MSAIEEKVVSFRANIGEFKSKMIETLNIFNRVNSGLGKGIKLDTKSAENGLKSFKATANNISLEKIQNGVEKLNDKFSTMGIIGITAISNIATAVQTKLAGAIDAMTFKGARDGFAEYELNMNSIKTIMANVKRQGYGIDDVKKSLNELNEYADKTVYKFSDMTKSIGRFTAAGVDLKKATIAIQGMSNVAAGAGADKEELARAMYQTSQALGKGYFQNNDWMSITNASMDTAQLKEELIATAEALGKIEKGSVTLENFRASLEKKKGQDSTWLTSDIFIKTMEKLAKDEYLLKAATEITSFGQLVDTTFEMIGTSWAGTWQYILGDYEQSKAFFTSIGNTITGWIADNANGRNEVLKSWSELGGTTRLLQSLKNIIETIVMFLRGIDIAWEKVFPRRDQVNFLTDITKKFEEFTSKLKPSGAQLYKFVNVVSGYIKFFRNMGVFFYNTVKNLWGLVPKSIFKVIKDIIVAFGEFNNRVNIFDRFDHIVNSFTNLFKPIIDILDSFILDFPNKTKNIFKSIGDFLSFKPKGDGLDLIGVIKKPIDLLTKFLKSINLDITPLTDIFSKIIDSIIKLDINTAISSIATIFTGLQIGKISQSLNTLGDSISNFLPKIDISIGTGSSIRNLLYLSVGLSAFILSLNYVSKTDTAKLSSALGVMGMLTISLYTLINGLNRIKPINKNVVKTFKQLSISMIILAISLRILDNVDAENARKNLYNVSIVLLALLTTTGILNKIGPINKSVTKTLRSLINSLIFISLSFKILESVNSKNVGDNLINIGYLLSMLMGTTYLLSKLSNTKTNVKPIQKLSNSLLVMVTSVSLLNTQDPNKTKNSLDSITSLLMVMGGLVLVLNSIPKVNNVGSFTTLAIALNVMMIPIYILNAMDHNKTLDSIKSVVIMLTSLSLITAIFSKFMSIKTIGFVGAMIGIVSAITLLLPAITAISLIPSDMIVKSILAIIGVLTAISLTTMILGKIAFTGMVKFAIAMNLLALSGLIAGKGINLIADGILKFIAIVGSIIAAGPAISTALGIMLDAVISNGKKIVEVVISIAMGIFEGLVSSIPRIASGLLSMLLSLLHTINDNIPKFLDVGTSIVINIANGLIKSAGRLINAAVLLILQMLNGMAKSIGENADIIIDTMSNVIKSLLVVILELLSRIPVVGGMFSGALNDAKADLDKSTADMQAKIEERSKKMEEATKQSLPNGMKDGIDNANQQISQWDITTPMGAKGLEASQAFKNGLSADERDTFEKFKMDVQNSNVPLLFQELGVKSKDEFITKANEISLTDLLTKLQTQIGEANLTNVLQKFGIDNIAAITSLTPEAQDKLRAFITSGIILTQPEAKSEAHQTGVEVGQSFNDGVSSQANTPVQEMDEIQANMRETVDLGSFNDLGRSAMNQFSSGVDSGTNQASNSGRNVALNARSGFSSVSTYGAGLNFVDGAESGIHSGRSRLFNAAASVARSALSGFNQTLEIRSPSRVMKRSGHWFVQGVVEGIGNSSHNAYDKVKTLGEQMIDTVNNTMDNLVSENLYEFETTIIPTLDTSSLNAVKLNGHVNDVNFQNLKIAYDKLNNQLGSSQVAQTTVKIQNENRGLLEGAVFHVREEADIEKFAVEIDRRMRLQSDISKIIGRANI